MVLPSSTSFWNKSKIWLAVVESRLPVGSSVAMIGGSLASARGDGGALLLSARELAGRFVGMLGDADQFKQVHGARFAFLGIEHVAEIHRDHHVLQHGERGQQLKELEHHTDLLAAPLGHLAFAELTDRNTADQHLPLGRAVDAGEHVDQGGLAAAGFADHGDKFSRANLQIDPFQCGKLPGLCLIDLVNIL